MRLRTCNNRKARRKRASKERTPFCYILFKSPYIFIENVSPSFGRHNRNLVYGVKRGDSRSDRRFVDKYFCYNQKEHFPSYADAIVWLTKIKLSLMDKPEKFRLFELASIVEGYYTKGKREYVIRTTDLTNVSHSLPTARERRDAKQRQLRQQRYNSRRLSKAVATGTSTATSTSNLRSSWTTAISGAATALGGDWDGPSTVSFSDGGTVSFSN